ncbi:MAG: pantetheine-phosphate adenylyltransferase [Bdellovibrionales bacterium]|nr:pantetheine-phosphate adenylyltransferase [Bdellovibrionales bacterium]
MQTAVYAGTFDPFTNGHRDIVERASKLFERVHVAIAESTSKRPLFDADERVALTKQALKAFGEGVVVEKFNGLLVNYVASVGADVIIRGLRAVSDYEYEYQIAAMNRELAPKIETVFLMASQQHSFINSTIVKEVARFGGDVSSLVPENIGKRLKDAFQGQ